MKSGFVTIVGRPNVGKSTFINATVGEKIAIMSNKPQTTRNTIQGIYTDNDSQIIFIDTPGIHKPKHELGHIMTEMAYNSLTGVDVILFMISAKEHIGVGDQMIIDRLKKSKVPVFLIINKIDLLKKENLVDETIIEYMNQMNFAGIYPISALEKTNIDKLLTEIKNILPEGPKYYPDDQITNNPERFIIAEIIREKILHFTMEEVPHSVAVIIESLKPSDEREDIIDCYASIIVERPSQKKIIIGKEGAMLKKIGTAARKEINAHLGSRIHLDLWVKVKKDWRDKNVDLKNFGYTLDDF